MKNVLGIVRNNWTGNEKGYYFSALDFYDEVIYINPKEVTYSFQRESNVPIVDYHGFPLNNLSMLYVFGYHRATLLLVQSLILCGCPISDTYETLTRKGIGKVGERLTAFSNHSATTSYIVGSYKSAKDLFTDFSDDAFPLVSKPIFGNKGKGIEKLDNKKATLKYLRSYFSDNTDFIVLESFMHYIKEWRVYVVDGEILFSYEKIKPEGSFLANIHQSARPLPIDKNDREMIYAFIKNKLTDEYRYGIYGVDIALTNKGSLHIIEINRTPGWSGAHHIADDFIFPAEVHKRLIKRARLYPAPRETESVTFVITGDIHIGEHSPIRRSGQRLDNILHTQGYHCYPQSLSSIVEQTDRITADSKIPVRNMALSPLKAQSQQIHRTDINVEPPALKTHNIRAVSTANKELIQHRYNTLVEVPRAEPPDMRYLGAAPNQKEEFRIVEYDVTVGDARRRCIIAVGHHRITSSTTPTHPCPTTAVQATNPGLSSNAGQEIRDLRKQHADAFIVAYPYWGITDGQVTQDQAVLAHTLVDAGADLVIGYGPQIMQAIEQYKRRWILYSLGKPAIHTSDRYPRQTPETISLLVRLHFSPNSGTMKIAMRLYPIYTHNTSSNYRSDFVTDSRLRRTLSFFIQNSSVQRRLVNKFRLGNDGIGKYLAVDL